MFRKQLTAAGLAFLFISVFVLGCGKNNKPKEELLKDGVKLMDEQNSRGAVVLFKNALEKDQNYFEARFQLAKAYYNLGNYDSAEKELQKVIRQNPSLKDARIELAKINVQKGSPDEALKGISEYIGDDSADAEALEAAGWAYIAKKDYQNAVSYLKKSISLGNKAETRLSLAKVYMEMGDKQGADAQIKELLEKDPGNIRALYLLAEFQTAQDNRKAALETYERILRDHPSDLYASFKKGALLIDNGKYDEAITLAQGLTEKYPNKAEGYRLRGLAMLHKKDYEGAITSLQKALTYSADPGSYYFLGLGHYYKGELEQATSQFQKSLDLVPGFAQPRLMLSLVHLRQNRLDDSVTEIKRALEIEPGNALGHNILGSAYMAKGMQEEGLAELNKAIELDPGLIDAHVKKGVFNMSKGKFKEAESSLKRAVDAAPELLNSRVLLATYYMRNKDFGKAKEILSKGLGGGKGDAVVHSMLGEILLQEGKVDEGVRSFEKSKASNPDYPAPYMSLSTVYILRGKQDKGIEELKALLQKSPDNLKALFTLASVLEATGKADEAAQYYKKAEATGKPEAYISLASLYLRKKEINKAVGFLDMVIQKEPKSPLAYEVKGKAFSADKRYKEALKVFEELERINPNAGSAYMLDTYLAMDDHKNALELVKKRLAKEPENPELLAELARVYSLMGKLNEAEDAAKRIIAMNPDSSAGYTVLATVYQSARQEAKTLEALKKAASMKGKNITPHMMLGLLYTAKKDYDSALDTYRKAEKVSPNNAQLIFQQGAVLEIMNKKKEAVSEYQRALRVSPNFVPALNNIAYITAESDPAKALQMAKRAFVLAPKDGAVLDTFGMVLTKTGNYGDAVKVLRNAVEALSGNPTVLYHYAVALKGNGDKALAAEMLQKAIKAGEFPDSAKAKQLLSELKNGTRKAK